MKKRMNFSVATIVQIVTDAASPSGKDPPSSSGGSYCHVTSAKHVLRLIYAQHSGH
jgi:hypothetical protein